MKKILILAFCLVFLASANLFAQSIADVKVAIDVETAATLSYEYDGTNYAENIDASTDVYVFVYASNVNVNILGYEFTFSYSTDHMAYKTKASEIFLQDENILVSGFTAPEIAIEGGVARMAASLPDDNAGVTSSGWKLLGLIVFTTDGSFTTSTASYFTLTGVQFIVPGGTTYGAGTNASPSDNAININANTTNGAINTTTPESSTVLPVDLVDFAADAGNNFVDLAWTTASELNNFGFEVERGDGVNFEKIGFVSGNGTTDEEMNYAFTDEGLAAGTYFYRLKQVDYDGNFAYSGVVEAVIVAGNFKLNQNYPNPFNPTTNITFDIKEKAFVELTVTNALGQVVETLASREMVPGHYNMVFNAKNLASGTYFYTLKAGNLVSTKKLTVIK